MYCPECGADAGPAKFCPECGTDLRDLAAPPGCDECGSEVPDGARFCPECGEPVAAGGVDAEPAAPAASRRTGTRGKSAGSGRQAQQRRQQPRPQQAAATAAPQPGRVSPAVAWGVLGAVVVVAVVVVVLFAGGGDGGSAAPAPTTASQSVQPVAADTSGSFGELVQRGNDLYDQGAAKFQAGDYDQGGEFFRAAAKVYAAAWKQQSTDPAVGTDYATSLFYSGRIEAAVKQVEEVLAQSPDFQTAWFNKGNYLVERAHRAEEAGDDKAAEQAYADARVAYQKAVDLDPESASGQSAQQQLDELPK